MLRHGVRALLERHGVEVVAEASDGRMAAAAAREHHPDVAVLDILMPLLNGIDAAREIAATCPDTQVVLLTALDQERLVTEAVSAGVRGFVLKTQAEEDLVQAIEQVSRGGFYVGGGVSRAGVDACPAPAAQDRGRLTPRERPVVLLVANAFGTWLSQALANLVKARGYRVHFVLTGRELLDQAPAVRPDIIVLDADLPDLDSVAVCRTLRENRAAWNMPVIMITTTPATKQQRLAALEAGAWDYLSVLLNPEELTLKVDAMARLKLEMDRVLEESAVDPASGLYTVSGLERRAGELASDAGGRRAPLPRVALRIGLDPNGAARR